MRIVLVTPACSQPSGDTAGTWFLPDIVASLLRRGPRAIGRQASARIAT